MGYVFVLVMYLLCSFNAYAEETWQSVTGIKESDIKEVKVKAGVIYAASEKRLYRSRDNGESWESVFLAEADEGIINSIAVSESGVFICTYNGVFKSSDGISNWNKVFKGIGIGENNILCITFLEDIIFLATESGVYKGPGSNWKRIFITSGEEIKSDAEYQDETTEATNAVNGILINEDKIYLAADSGIFATEDQGNTWNRFTSNGLLSQKIKDLLFKDNLYAATDKGIFIFNDKEERWEALYKGMTACSINSISMDADGIVWAATDKGLYVAKESKLGLDFLGEDRDVRSRFSHEPTIRQVQNAAIEYAEVNLDKIKNWRKRANLKALFPEFSLDYDKTITYDSGVDRYYVGPYDWGASVKWDLGEIIWNGDQTSIDVRSKLMVQLRDDILGEATRTYFERRRLQMEMYFLPAADLKRKIERELRIEELTADLDALTGGYFSESLYKILVK